jgi:polyisoprenoid-binding protein YceI
MRDIS